MWLSERGRLWTSLFQKADVVAQRSPNISGSLPSRPLVTSWPRGGWAGTRSGQRGVPGVAGMLRALDTSLLG